MCKVYTGYCGTSEIEHGFANARDYLSVQAHLSLGVDVLGVDTIALPR